MLILQKNSVAKKYVLILVFSLLPFIIGITYSLFQSNDRAYYSAAINISGSQRMRTMLLSNYSQQYVSSTLANQFEDMKNAKEVLLKEKVIYDKFYNALLSGESSLKKKRPDNEEIAQVLKELEPFINNYLLSIESVLIDYNDKDSLCDQMNISVSELARRLGQSPQNFGKKLKRETITLEELKSIAEVMDVKFEQTFILPDGKEIKAESE